MAQTHKLLLFVVLTLLYNDCFAQMFSADKMIYNTLNTNIQTGYQIPLGDMSKRFGNSQCIGLGIEYMTKKNHVVVGITGDLFWGNVVKEDPLTYLRTPEGEIIGNNRSYADVALRERGFNIGAYLGKLFNIRQQKNSFIRTSLGLGLLQHKIRIQDNSQSVTQITGDYKKGYDRLSNGLSFTQFIGYQYIRASERSSFYIGMEALEAIVRSRRDWDFASMKKDTSSRIDILLSLKVGWSLIFPIGIRAEDIEY